MAAFRRSAKYGALCLLIGLIVGLAGRPYLGRSAKRGKSGIEIPQGPIAKGQGAVVHIADGDTLTIRPSDDDAGGREGEEKMRLIGIDTPELNLHKPEPPEPYSEEARGALAALCPVGSTISIERHGKDKYGRTLARLFVDGRDVNRALIERGLARCYFLKSRRESFEEEYGEAERRAQEARLGIWSR